jgi:hypothetical protein
MIKMLWMSVLFAMTYRTKMGAKSAKKSKTVLYVPGVDHS